MLDLNAAFAVFPMLQTERLVLRAVNADDVPTIFRIMSDARVMRYLDTGAMVTVEQAAARVRAFEASFREQNGIRWAITRRGSPQLIGTCGYWRIVKPHFRAEIGYELAPDAWGQGVMPEAIGAVVQWGFTTMNLHSVEAQIDPANTGSRRVLEKCGFVQEGYFRENFYQNGVFGDTAVFSAVNPNR